MAELPADSSTQGSPGDEVYDYVIVGSGPGGGPLAANLARAGFKVALLECGSAVDLAEKSDATAAPTYAIPGLFGAASEHQFLSWDVFVKHYKRADQSELNDKYVANRGMLYPRGSTLGGSAAHNALLWVYPHDEDFDYVANLTGDESWKSAAMRKYFQRVERCEFLVEINNRRAKAKTGVGDLLAAFFEGIQVAPGAAVTRVVPGYDTSGSKPSAKR